MFSYVSVYEWFRRLLVHRVKVAVACDVVTLTICALAAGKARLAGKGGKWWQNRQQYVKVRDEYNCAKHFQVRK